MARTQSKNYPEIREGILKSAAKLFAAKGYPNTSIVDLAEACNSSRGALYHYFESKEQILLAILETHLETVLGDLNAIDSQRLEPTQHLRTLVRRLMLLNSRNQAEQITLLNETNQLDEAARTRIAGRQREIVDLFVAALARLDAQKRMTPNRRKAYGMMLLGALNYTYAWYDPKGSVTPEAYADMTVDAFVGGFVNPRAEEPPKPRRQIRKEIV
jgi:AcrR family transcriptional regulator